MISDRSDRTKRREKRKELDDIMCSGHFKPDEKRKRDYEPSTNNSNSSS